MQSSFTCHSSKAGCNKCFLTNKGHRHFEFSFSSGLIWTPWSILQCWRLGPTWHSSASIDLPVLTVISYLLNSYWAAVSRHLELNLMESLVKWQRLSLEKQDVVQDAKEKHQGFVGIRRTQTGLVGYRERGRLPRGSDVSTETWRKNSMAAINPPSVHKTADL